MTVEIVKIEEGNIAIKDAYQKAYNKAVLNFQNHLLEQPQFDLPVFHDFAPGVYIRTMYAPAGINVIGKMHKTEHFNICLSGSAKVMINGEIKTIKAPSLFVSKANTKKLFNVIEDMVYLTIHPTNETDTDVLEDVLTHDLKEEERILLGG